MKQQAPHLCRPPRVSATERGSTTKRTAALRSVELLGKLAALFGVRRKQLAESVGLTDQQWQVLEEVQDTHFMPSLFAQRRESSPAAVSKLLRQLTDKNLITAEVSPIDARQRDYRTTDRGQAILDQLLEERQRAIDEVWLRFTKGQLTDFNTFGEELVRRLDAIASRRSGRQS